MAAEKVYTPEEVAQSAYRAFCFAGGVQEEPSWDREPEEFQQRWLQLAFRAQSELLDFDGKPVHQAARHLAGIWSQGALAGPAYDALEARLRLCWEAVTRHLSTLLDSEDLEDREALERSWGEWMDKRIGR